MTNYILSQFLYESKNSAIDVINRIAFLFFHFKISKRIGTLSVLPYFKVQVVSGRIAGGTDITDDFALFHFLPYGHADRGTVGIQGVKSIVMVYLDIVSIPAAPSVDGIGNGDCAICRCQNRCTTRSADIGSAVVGNFSSKGVLTVSKP